MSDAPTKVLVSACLVGCNCRYDGRHSLDPELADLLSQRGEEAVPFCPEEEGGLATPRPPAWIEAQSAEAVLGGEDRVVASDDLDLTDAFLRGARMAAAKCRARGIERAYLKERSPSCGVRTTHVAGRAVSGPGVTACLLAREGIEVVGMEGIGKAKQS
ncbi:MAG: DUF523 domain-containing protein [bacterium]|jgi:uncharacterized protein YbbK (DUF523 family)|nr:DUF523 domain-containing protein [Planctomycetota bacterium]HIL52685.1 DUF523 domain-containing protein [Planctomycetota bacterium]